MNRDMLLVLAKIDEHTKKRRLFYIVSFGYVSTCISVAGEIELRLAQK